MNAYESPLARGARLIAHQRDEEAVRYTRAVQTARELISQVGEGGIAQNDLVKKVAQTTGVPVDIALYGVCELWETLGLARRDRATRIVYPLS